MQGVEGVEELLLRALTAGDELDIVHHENICAAVLVAELRVLVLLDGLDEFVCEGFARHINDARIRVVLQHPVADGVHQVRFSKAPPAVNEQRVVSGGRVVRNGLRRSMREVVRAADHEGFKRIFGVQRKIAAVSCFSGVWVRVIPAFRLVDKAHKIARSVRPVHGIGHHLRVKGAQRVF